MTGSNPAASVRARLNNLARQRGRTAQELMQLFVMERFLYRLGISPQRDRFVLKGALLLRTLDTPDARPTRDIDLLGRTDNTPETISALVQRICSERSYEDGVEFDTSGLKTRAITEGAKYHGLRVEFMARLGTARLPMQIDVGIGDAIPSGARTVHYPSLLDHPQPDILGYPLESTIAEKTHAIVALGLMNSRMKDFFDLYYLSRNREFELGPLREALTETFHRRSTARPTKIPLGLTNEFATHADKTAQWRGFLRRTGLAQTPLAEAVEAIRAFIWPALTPEGDSRLAHWPKGGPWSASK